MSDPHHYAWEVSLSRQAKLFLCAIADTSDSYMVKRMDSKKSPLLTLQTLVRLAVEVIRNNETSRRYPYTAVRQLRLRSSQAQKRSMKARVEKIGEYFGGAIPVDVRSMLKKCNAISVDSEISLQHIDGDVWQIRSALNDDAPVLSWQALVSLAVTIIRDPLLEELFPNLYVPYLRTPHEALEWNRRESDSPVSEESAEVISCPCTDEANSEERAELEEFLQELIEREERLQRNQMHYEESLCSLKAREQKLYRLEEHLIALQAKIQANLPPQDDAIPKRKKKRRSRHRR